jgi:hypothetical protein
VSGAIPYISMLSESNAWQGEQSAIFNFTTIATKTPMVLQQLL